VTAISRVKGRHISKERKREQAMEVKAVRLERSGRRKRDRKKGALRSERRSTRESAVYILFTKKRTTTVGRVCSPCRRTQEARPATHGAAKRKKVFRAFGGENKAADGLRAPSALKPEL